ncbi:MFS transporter permease [Microbacterium sulfonylureivorans]|uniref:MFS transporter permease n=1 Tax=Microbacterium sulfonylureivorans TaxID=2486854 RepID=UPI000FDC5C14|nr:MFS transporter permease [Microbacterium sulfonylureivorans]
MWLRRGFFGWMIPAAFVLPLWLLVGWAVFNAGGWAFLWVLFLAIPGVFLWQLLLTLLVRARGTVRAHRAVSWWDVLGFTVWHLLVISLGFFDQAWWAPVMVVTVLVGVGLFWLELWQLWSEAKPSRMVMHTVDGVAYLPPMQERTEASVQEVIIVSEKQGPTAP